MKTSFFPTTILALGVAVLAAGCGEKATPAADLEKAANQFATAEAPPPPPPTGELTATAPAAAPVQQMREAVEAYKTGKLEDAVIRLQTLRATPVMTGPQRMALNDAMAAVMNDIYSLAAKGDARAIQAVKQYEKMQTQRR